MFCIWCDTCLEELLPSFWGLWLSPWLSTELSLGITFIVYTQFACLPVQTWVSHSFSSDCQSFSSFSLRNDWGPPDRKVDTRKYRAEPRSIFDYEPGKSSILEQEKAVSGLTARLCPFFTGWDHLYSECVFLSLPAAGTVWQAARALIRWSGWNESLFPGHFVFLTHTEACSGPGFLLNRPGWG